MDVKHCAGCRNNFYNGNNPHNVTECWSLKDAKLIWLKPVRLDERPPWTAKSVRKPSCYHQKGYIYVAPKVTH